MNLVDCLTDVFTIWLLSFNMLKCVGIFILRLGASVMEYRLTFVLHAHPFSFLCLLPLKACVHRHTYRSVWQLASRCHLTPAEAIRTRMHVGLYYDGLLGCHVDKPRQSGSTMAQQQSPSCMLWLSELVLLGQTASMATESLLHRHCVYWI